MKRQPFCNFMLAGLSLTEFGLFLPSPFSSLELANSEITSMTSWTLKCVVGGDANRHASASAFEALLYSAAQSAAGSAGCSGIPVSFAFGWLNDSGSVDSYISYQGFTLQFDVSCSGLYLIYTVKGYASLAVQSSMPAIRIPEVRGVVQPSAIVQALAEGTKATSYYNLDIDHNDAPTLVEHGSLVTSFNSYVRGNYTGQDDYDTFPGLVRLSKSYNSDRTSGGLIYPYRKLSTVLANRTVSPVSSFLKGGMDDSTPQCTSFSYWVDEPTMTQPGTIHYKSNANLVNTKLGNTLEYGTSNTNILSISGSYNGVAYNMTDMSFSQVGFALDGSGNSIVNGAQVVNSWSSSLSNVFQTADIINDVNALASQFSGSFTVVVPGTTKQFTVAQPVSLLVMSGNTLSPISGVYNIISVGHTVNNQFTTTLKLQRLMMSSANSVASGAGISYSGGAGGGVSQTSNIVSPYKVDFGDMYPTFEHMTLPGLSA